VTVGAEQIIALSCATSNLEPAICVEIERSYLDTLAVMCAGWNGAASRAVRRLYPEARAPWDDSEGQEPETLALIWGTAAHALDYDDVHMTSITHPSAVLVPALEAASLARPAMRARRASAFALGLAVNVALGRALGFAHYERGWHATSTVGSVAAAAAVAHLYRLDDRAFRSALAIAAAQAGGLQANFGTMAKPLQAGLAAQAGVRSARLAEAGLVAANDIFAGPNGFLAVYSDEIAAPLELDIADAAAGLSRKLYPCCYLAHRPVLGAIRLRERGAARRIGEPEAKVEVETPAGCLKALTVGIPTNGSEAKFSGQYTVARALSTGRLTLADFEDEAVRDPGIIELASRVWLRETADVEPGAVGIDRGEVTVRLSIRGEVVDEVSVAHYPGSPAARATDAELEAKLIDCLSAGAPGHNGLERRLRAMASAFEAGDGGR
jgi:2-methylcitrate dehydratase PrpD